MNRNHNNMQSRRKELAFRALQARCAERGGTQPRPLAHAGLVLTAAVVMAFCAANDTPFAGSASLRSVVQAAFCVVAAALYALSMVLSIMYGWIQTCVDDRAVVLLVGGGRLPSVVQEEEERRQRQQQQQEEEGYALVPIVDGRPILEEGDISLEDEEDDEDDNNNNEERPMLSSTASSSSHHARRMLPREVVVSSMYLGGVGCFLAIAPLCMWDEALTPIFLVSLLAVSLWDAPPEPLQSSSSSRKQKEEEGDDDEEEDKLKKKRKSMLLDPTVMLRWALATTLIGTLLCAWAVEEQRRRMLLSSLPLLLSGEINHTSRQAAALRGDDSAIAELLGGGEAAIVRPRWPFLILSGISPILLRAGSGAVYLGGLHHTMTPTQTLETGLPVILVLSGLILSRFSPLEEILMTHTAIWRASTFWPMLCIVPMALTAELALLLFTLRRRTSLVAVAALAMLLVVRQQQEILMMMMTAGVTIQMSGAQIGAIGLAGLSSLLAVSALFPSVGSAS